MTRPNYSSWLMMRSLLLLFVSLLSLSNTHASSFQSFKDTSFCDRIHPEDLPEECSCSEPRPLSLVVECQKSFENLYFNDTIGLKIVVDPCNDDGSSISLDVTETNHNIDYVISGIRAGELTNIPIPGLAIVVPTIGNFGVDASVLISGNPDSLKIKVGINACLTVTQKQVCAGSIPILNEVLPWWVLSGTYSFGDICKPNNETKASDAEVATE